MNKIFDTHAHYDDEKFDEDRYDLLDSMPKEGIGYIINVGVDLETSLFSIELSNRYDYIYAACGIHPHEATNDRANLQKIQSLFKDKEKVKAVGEIGLDYYYDFSPRETQKEIFRKQLEFAKEKNIPVIIHDRDAHKDTLDIVKEFEGIKGVFHCFSGSPEMAEIVINLGFHISFGGTLTFKNSKKPKQVLEIVPEDRILAETDSPYLTPVPHRGKRNDSRYTAHVIKKIAEIRNISYEKAIEITYNNAIKLFAI